jgi:hypothetical protein
MSDAFILSKNDNILKTELKNLCKYVSKHKRNEPSVTQSEVAHKIIAESQFIANISRTTTPLFLTLPLLLILPIIYLF